MQVNFPEIKEPILVLKSEEPGSKQKLAILKYYDCYEIGRIERGNEKVVFAYRSTCIKRRYGAVIVKDDVVVSTGYNGSPRGTENCCDMGTCPRMERDMHQGEGYVIGMGA